MQESNKLTEQKYWRDSWKNIKLPARYFYGNYSHVIISDLVEKFISSEHKNFLEIGGCPGRWADYFYAKHGMTCDSMDYDEDNIEKSIWEQGFDGKGIFIDDEVWIGSGSRILDGSKIEKGSIIGAGSIVTKFVPKNGIVYGEAAKVKYFRNKI